MINRAVSYGTSGNDTLVGFPGGVNQTQGGDGNDSITGSAYADTLSGGAGNDTIIASEGNNALSGDADKDLLIALSGADTLRGGTGNDDLEGGTGNDRYDFAIGDGADGLYDAGGTADLIRFLDVKSTDVTSVERADQHLIVRYGASDSLTVKRFFNGFDSKRSLNPTLSIKAVL